MKTNHKQSLIALLTASAIAIPFAFAAGEPDNVQNVSAVSKDATTLEVSWDEAKDDQGNDVDHYRIYYGAASVQGGDADSYDVEVDTPDNATTYDLTELEAETTYYMSVTAIDGLDVESLEYSIETSGTPTEAQAEEGDTIAPTVVNVAATDSTHVLIGFSEKIVLPGLLPEAAFTVTEQINPANVLEVMSAELFIDDPEGKTVMIETAAQTKNVNYILTASVAITDESGNPIESGNTDSGLFLGSDLDAEGAMEEEVEEVVEEEEDLDEVADEDEVDVTPPEDITDLILSFREQLEKFVIVMNWTASLNTAKDLVDQVLYQSMDLGVTYDSGTSLGPVSTDHEVANLEGGKEYTFKLTTKDDSGNESVGMVKSIRLPQTGLGAGMLLFGSMAAASRVLRRRKDDEGRF